MGAPTSEVGYTLATTRRGDHEVYMDMWWRWGKTIYFHVNPDFATLSMSLRAFRVAKTFCIKTGNIKFTIRSILPIEMVKQRVKETPTITAHVIHIYHHALVWSKQPDREGWNM
jgi:hypothetical protein